LDLGISPWEEVILGVNVGHPIETSGEFLGGIVAPSQITLGFFSPLGKVAGRAIYFTDVFSIFFFLFFF